MTVSQIIQIMETKAPAALAEEWDNVGLLVGDPRAEVSTAVITLDVTEEVLSFAKEQGAELIIAHHPLIFSPVKRVLSPSVLYKAALNGVAVFAAHTNLDAADGGVNDALAAVLGLSDVETAFDGIGRVGVLPATMTANAFAALVKERLHTPVQMRAGTRDIRTVGLVGGAGGDYAEMCEADAFVTGEIKHHEWLALPADLTVVAAGHYATEVVVVEPLTAYLKKQCPCVQVLSFIGTPPYTTI